MALQPLTHHEILGWVEPFARRGRQVDLAASNRLERRLAFKAVACPAAAAGLADLSETLQLESIEHDVFRLTRRLAFADGLEARLQAEGRDLAALLAGIEAVGPMRQFRLGEGFAIAFSHRLPPGFSGSEPALELTGATARAGELALRLQMPTVRGMPAELELQADADEAFELPEDLLAVLGWSWARLARAKQGWAASLRLARREPARSSDAEAKFVATAAHLARTLAEPPTRFHQRFQWARWRVVLRRAVPLLACFGLVAGAASLPRFELAQDSPLRMILFNSPPLLLVVFFCLRELPRIEIPPLPRPSTSPAWRTPAPMSRTDR